MSKTTLGNIVYLTLAEYNTLVSSGSVTLASGTAITYSADDVYIVPDPIDSSPTANSTNPVTSGGIKTYVDNAISGRQAADADLTAIAALTGTSGLLRKTATNTWELDTNNYAGSSSKGGAANSAAKLTNTTAIGSSTEPVYFSANGVPLKCSLGNASTKNVGTGANNVAAGNHTHNYAASSSAGGSATTAINLTGTTTYAIPYQSASATTAYVAPNTTTTKKFFTMTGNGSNGATPTWATLVNGDIPTNLTSKTYNGVSITNTENTSVVISGAKTLTLKGNLTTNSNYTLGAACEKSVTDAASGISSSGTSLTTGKAVYLYAVANLASNTHSHGQMNYKGQLTTIVGTEGNYNSSYIPLIYGSTIGDGSDTNLLIKSALVFNSSESSAGTKFLAKSGKFVDVTGLGFATQTSLNNAYQTAGNTSSSSKLYILGVDTVSSTNGSYKVTHYASTSTYAQGDKLHSGTVAGYTEVQSAKVSVGTVSSDEVTTKASMQYNSTDNCIEFVFA